MTLYDFNGLDDSQKQATTWDLGTHVNTLKFEDITLVLYSIENFYVEIEYLSKNNSITTVRSFKTGERLEQHLSTIDLDI